MSRFHYADLIIELSDLCCDICSEIRYQLNYYRASVYKEETAKTISYRIEKLRTVSKIINDDVLNEAFSDYDSMKKQNPATLLPGECSFTTRTTHLLTCFEKRCEELSRLAQTRQLENKGLHFARKLQKYRKELLSLCRQGSRHWTFFQSL